MGHHELLNTIGCGSFGEVSLGQHITTWTEVTVKAIHHQKFVRLHRPILKEVNCIAVLHHLNIVELYEVIGTENVLFLFMGYMNGGDLGDYRQTHGPMIEDEVEASSNYLYQQCTIATTRASSTGT